MVGIVIHFGNFANSIGGSTPRSKVYKCIGRLAYRSSDEAMDLATYFLVYFTIEASLTYCSGSLRAFYIQKQLVAACNLFGLWWSTTMSDVQTVQRRFGIRGIQAGN